MEQGKTAIKLREQWLGHREAREHLLLNAVCMTNEWIAGLEDTELGDIGRQFLDGVRQSGRTEKIDIRQTGIAHYSSFSLTGKDAFPNNIIYGPSAEEDIANLFSSKVHETTHALQKMHSAALHASPFNPNTQIIVCPRDWITLEERCEQDAYVKQGLFNSLLAKILPEVRRMSDRDALSVKTFEKIRLASANIAEALVEAARQALGKSFYWDNPDHEWRFRHHYQEFALKTYAAGMETRKNQGEKDFIFVRIEPEDIAAIGASCGPNTFGEKGLLPEFAENPQLPQKTADRLAEINMKLGIENEEALPTLGEVLQKLGISRKEFIAASYGRPFESCLQVPAPTPGIK